MQRGNVRRERFFGCKMHFAGVVQCILQGVCRVGSRFSRQRRTARIMDGPRGAAHLFLSSLAADSEVFYPLLLVGGTGRIVPQIETITL
jgi:hypothetical protein